MSFVRTLTAAAAMAAIVAGTSAATAGDGVKIGVLECDIAGGAGFIFGSSKSVDCVFSPTEHGPRDHYVGSIDKYGIDIGFTEGTHVIWAVFAPGIVRRGSLAGQYVGATGEATLGVGVGANVLIGGGNDSIELQPVSIQGQSGWNVAGGVASLTLRSH